MQPSPAKSVGAPSISAKERLIIAVNTSNLDEARELVKKLGDSITFYKIGLQLQLASGLEDFLAELISSGKKVFLDYKYYDIEDTVEHAVEKVAQMGASFLTVHGNGSIIKAAIKGRGNSALKILSVTVLTSLDAYDMKDLGFDCSVEDLVLRRSQKAHEAGCDGVIASGLEVEQIRSLVGDGLLIVVPGVRSSGAKLDDHKRSITPSEAIMAGADYLVVGRPIYNAPDPKSEAQAYLEEMQKAFDLRNNSVSGF